MEIIIVGGGQIGSYIAGLLLKNNHTVKVIENRVKAIEIRITRRMSDNW